MRALLLLIAVLCTNFATSQILDPVKWSFSSNQVNDSEFDLIFTAKIDDGWYVYTQYLEGEDGPVPTSFYYDDESLLEFVGKNIEAKENRKEGFDKLFQMNIVKYSKKAVFTQRIKLKDSSKPITGYLEFMTCDDTRCLPPDEVDFSFQLKPKSTKADETTSAKTPAQPKESPDSKTIKGVETIAATTEKEDNAPEITTPTNGILEPVHWSASITKINDTEYDLLFKAKIDEGWSVYSQFVKEDGPIPTTFYFDESNLYELVGDAKEEGPKKIEGFDKLFNMNVVKYKKEVTFTQKVKTTDNANPITGAFEFMTCDDTKCLPPAEVPFKINLSKLTALVGDEADETPPITLDTGTTNDPFKIDIDKTPIEECDIVTEEEEKGLWGIFILGVLGGFVALLTPCVFPMIPLTVSFFTKGSENKKKGLTNAFMYGFFILLVYLVLSLPFHLMDTINPDILNDISTNIWLNISFFVIFLFFAGSFFGYYELTLPASWSNKASSAEGIGGMLGIFFMALTLALVSFSCTGPILGSLLAGALSSDGGAMQLTAGMAGFGFALALPFGLFAAFPGWLNSLPRSGGWLNTVKVVLGFLEIALALKFLSNADLVKRWGLLKIEPFLILWILTFLGLALYLFGKIKFPHDSPLKKLSATRIGLGLASIAFVIYLATGFRYDERAGTFTSLKLLSGLAPPVGYSWIYPNKCPQNLNCFKSFEEGLSYAKEINKPIMIDFTGHACVNCRKMEEHVWPTSEVYDLIDDEYVLISLYVDEKIELPTEEQIVVEKKTGGTRKLRTYGNKWAHFQSENFENNSQPWYVLLSSDGTRLLNKPVGYTPDAVEYADFLRCGLDAFNTLNTEKKVLGANQK